MLKGNTTTKEKIEKAKIRQQNMFYPVVCAAVKESKKTNK